MKLYYTVKVDKDCEGLLIIFATQEEIVEDCINGEFHDEGNINGDPYELLEDTGSMCEDYLIESRKYTKKSDIPIVKILLEQMGFIEDKRIKDCGWG